MTDNTNTAETSRDAEDFEQHMAGWHKGWKAGMRSALDQVASTITAIRDATDTAPDGELVAHGDLEEIRTVSVRPARAEVADAFLNALHALHGAARAAGVELDIADLSMYTDRDDHGNVIVSVSTKVQVGR